MNVRLAVRQAIQLQTDGQLAAAVDAYRAILKRHPENCTCWSNLGMALRTLGRKDEGLRALRQGVRVCPQVVELNYNLGNALADAGDPEGALTCYRAAFDRDVGCLPAAQACGAVLLRLKRFEQAVDHYAAALARHPDDAELYGGLGWALWKLRRVVAAAAACRRAVALDPASPTLHWKLHAVLRLLGRYEEDEQQLGAGVARHTDSPGLLAALGQSLMDQGRLDAGLEYCDAALAVDPDHRDARLARGRANFLAGRYRAAWPDRFRPVYGIDRRPKGTAGREWQGQSLAGQSILLYGEQGLGDVIQFARYAPLVAERGARVVVACQPRLVGLLRRLSRVDRVVPSDQPPPPTDWHCSLLDVPAVWGHDVDSIPGTCPYLPPVRRERPVLPPARQFRIGIVWAGNPTQKLRRVVAAAAACRRAVALDPASPTLHWKLHAVLRLLGRYEEDEQQLGAGVARHTDSPGLLAALGQSLAEFVSFQVGPRAEALRSGWRGLVHDPGAALADLEATADALLEVDLVITVDTMLAHLAGALGRPVWTLLAFAPDMRWMLELADTPWYPTMRLFRQPAPNDWAGLFREVRRELAARLARPLGDRQPSDAQRASA